MAELKALLAERRQLKSSLTRFKLFRETKFVRTNCAVRIRR